MTQSIQQTQLPNIDLTAAFTGVFSADYIKNNEPIPGLGNVSEHLRYGDLKTTFQNGDGAYQCNLLFQERNTLNSTQTKVYDFDGGLLDVFGNNLNYDSVKLIIIRNRNTTGNDLLAVEWRNSEAFNIGPQG